MSSNLTNTSPFLETSKFFPLDPYGLPSVLTQTYVDIANAVNVRDIALYDLTQVLTGQQWFTTTTSAGSSTNQKRNVFRQVFQLSTLAAGATTTITHNISPISIITFLGGTVITAVPDYRPLPFVCATAVTDQIEVRINSTVITIVNGATAPNITSGLVIVEWISTS